MAEHLLGLGVRRVAFVAVPNSTATVYARAAGYREALHAWALPSERGIEQEFDPADAASVAALMAERPDAILCANDRTAARLMHTLIALGHTVPRDVRLAGIDDLEYAGLLPVPLTTLRQPTRQIGGAALGAMLDTVDPARTPV